MSEYADVAPAPRAARTEHPPAALERRVAGWQYATKLHCPAGHLITRRDTFLTGTLVARCECGRAVLAIALTQLLHSVSPPGTLLFTLEISKAEAMWIQRARPPLEELLDRAGLMVNAQP